MFCLCKSIQRWNGRGSIKSTFRSHVVHPYLYGSRQQHAIMSSIPGKSLSDFQTDEECQSPLEVGPAITPNKAAEGPLLLNERPQDLEVRRAKGTTSLFPQKWNKQKEKNTLSMYSRNNTIKTRDSYRGRELRTTHKAVIPDNWKCILP